MPIYPNETCPLCGENPNITYICENCHEIFCDDCVEFLTEQAQLCLKCGGSEIQAVGNGVSECKQCGSREIRESKRLIPTCRSCGSSNVMRIEEKQKYLLESYKNTINETRLFISPLEKQLESLLEIRQKLIQLREDTPPCYHYPTLESDIHILFKLFDNAKNNIYEQTNHFFQEIQRNINYIQEIPITHPSNLPYIQEVLQLFRREHEKVECAANNAIEPLITRITPIQENLAFMEATQTLFGSFLGKITLEPEEKIVFGLKCKLSSGNNEQQDFNSKNGTILLTSKRLHFFHEQGMFKKRSVLLFSVQIEDLQHVEVKGRLKKKVALDFVNSMYQFTISKENREELIEWIEKARDFDVSNMLDELNLKKLRKYKLTLKLFTEELENAIYELIGFHGSKSKVRYTINQALHPEFYKTSELPYGNNLQSQPSIGKMGARSGHSGTIYPGSNNPVRYTVGQPSRMPNGSGSGQSNRGYYENPYPSYSHTNSKQHQNLNPTQGQPQYSGSASFGQKTYKNSSYITPSGHYGYPHDRNDFPNRMTHLHADEYDDPYHNQEPRFEAPEYEAEGGISPFKATHLNQFGGISQSSRVSQPPQFGQGPSVNEEFQIREQLEGLRKEEYALMNTISMLEQRFDGGYMNNVDFVKSYKELQKQQYQISTQMKHLKKYLTEKYETFYT